jgi:hypothetical protein
MRNPATHLLLKRDRDIKQAMAKQLDRSYVVIGRGGGGRYDHLAWREMIVSGGPAVESAISMYLPQDLPDGIVEADGDQAFNPLFAEAVEFCPVPLTGWQEWAVDHLEDHRKRWLAELERIQKALEDEPMFAIPFGRFMSGSRHEDWVSSLGRVKLEPEKAFENWSENTNRGLVVADVWYFTRPYIIWPVEAAGILHRHVTHVRGLPFYLERPSLNIEPTAVREVYSIDPKPKTKPS